MTNISNDKRMSLFMSLEQAPNALRVCSIFKNAK